MELLSQMSMQDLMALMQQGQAATAGIGGGGGGCGGGPQYSFGGGGGTFQQNTNDWYCTGCADRQFSKNTQCRNCGTSRELGVSDIFQIPDVIDKFLGGKVSQEMELQFRNLPVEQQKAVIERGSLFTARDPDAVLRNRMNQAAGGGGGQSGAGIGSVMTGFHDPQAPRPGDWYCSNCQDLQFGKNSSCRRCGLPREQVDHGKPNLDPESFLAPHNIDDDKKTQFLSMDSALQEQIMLKGTLAGSRDPTAVLCQRMGQALQSQKAAQGLASIGGMGGGGGQSQHGPRQGDWYCSVCHDLQFARNDKCRSCGTPRAVADTGEVPQLDAVQWVTMFNVDEDKKQQFLSMDPQMQQDIIGEGTLHGARDPTAVLVSRMNKFLKISKGMVAGLGKGGGQSFGAAATGKATGGAGPYDGMGGASAEDMAWTAYAKGFLQAMKGKGKGW